MRWRKHKLPAATIDPTNAARVTPWTRWQTRTQINTIAFAPDGQTLVAGSWDRTNRFNDGSVRLWRVADGTLLRSLIDRVTPVESLVFLPDGQTVVLGTRDGTVDLWRISDGALIDSFMTHESGLTSLALAPDGQTLASVGYEVMVRLWRLPNHTSLRAFQSGLTGLMSVAFAPDGQTLAAASGGIDQTVRLWQLSDSTLHQSLKHHTSFV